MSSSRGIVRAKGKNGQFRFPAGLLQVTGPVTILLSCRPNCNWLGGTARRGISKLRSSAEIDHNYTRGIRLAPCPADKVPGTSQASGGAV